MKKLNTCKFPWKANNKNELAIEFVQSIMMMMITKEIHKDNV